MGRPVPPTTLQDREAKVQALIERMSAGVAEAIASGEHWREVLRRQARFHQYSFGNQLLIAMQCPHATQVAGYRAWQRRGRQVRKGEKGIAILAPIRVRKEDEETGEERWILVGFRTEYVFDISQTEGEGNLPSVEDRLGWRAEEAFDGLKRFSEARGTRVEVRPTGSSALGYFHPGANLIVISPSQTGPWAVKVLAHEVAHSLLHPQGYLTKPRPQAEMEAESVAFVVMSALGFDDRQMQWDSFTYVADWNPKPKEVIEAGDRIAKAAREILAGLLGSAEGEAAA